MMLREESYNYGLLQDCVDSYFTEDDQGERLIADLRHILEDGYAYHYKKALAHLLALESLSAFAEKEPSNENND
jgi:hypothetical protein